MGRQDTKLFLERLGATFIIAFIIVLVVAAVLLALNDEEDANKLAEISYYMLVLGVILQLILLAKYGERETNSTFMNPNNLF